MNKIDNPPYLFKGQKFLAIFFIVRGVITLASSMFGGLLEIVFGIIILPSMLPSVLKKVSWDEKRITPAKIYIAAIIIFIIAMISVGQSMPKNTDTANNIIDSSRLVNNYVFDIPSLLGKNIDEVRKSFSQELYSDITEPTNEQMKGTTEWWNTISKSGVDLLITYNPKTRKVIDFFLGGDNKNTLMQIGNLKENANDYSIESVQAIKNPNEITGIKIISK